MKTILQIISDTNIGGGGRSLLNYLHFQDCTQFCSHVVLPRGSALKEQLDAMEVPIHEIDAMADKSMDLSAIVPLGQVIREVDPDLIHTHGSMSGRIAARLGGRKVVYTKHCAFPPGALMRSPLGRLMNRTMDACLSDGVIAIGPSAREILTQTGIPENKIHVLFNGVAPLQKLSPDERTAQRAAYGFGPGDFVLGILARLEPYKGQDALFDAARLLLDQGRPVRLLVAGGGSTEEHLRRRTAEFPQGTVHFTGFLSQVEQALGAMDLQVNASTESETSSLSLLEGMSIGLPALVSDVGGNPFLIRDGENGLVFPNRNSAQLAAQAARLMDDPQLREKMSRRAEEIFRENFTGESYAKHIEDIYLSVLKGAKHGTK